MIVLIIQESKITDQELKDLVASLAVAQAKTDEQMARTDKKIEAINKSLNLFIT